MAKFSKKHYEAIAEVLAVREDKAREAYNYYNDLINKIPSDLPVAGNFELGRLLALGRLLEVNVVVDGFTELFAEDNRAFDRERFLKAAQRHV